MQLFDFDGSDVRVVLVDDEPWFVRADVCSVLDVDPNNARRSLDEDEQGVVQVTTPGGEQGMASVNESGLYALVFKSRKPEAKKFRKWITSEVLPAIRKTGVYDRFDPENQTDLLVESERLLDALTKKVRELTPKAEVRDGIYDYHGGYTRNEVWKMARSAGIFEGSLPEFTKQLHSLGITEVSGKGFILTEKYQTWADDALYFNTELKEHKPNKNPHFNEAGKDAILEMMGKVSVNG